MFDNTDTEVGSGLAINKWATGHYDLTMTRDRAPKGFYVWFRSEQMIKLRDYLNKEFPIGKEENIRYEARDTLGGHIVLRIGRAVRDFSEVVSTSGSKEDADRIVKALTEAEGL